MKKQLRWLENQIAELEPNNSISKQQIQENEEEKQHRVESLKEFGYKSDELDSAREKNASQIGNL